MFSRVDTAFSKKNVRDKKDQRDDLGKFILIFYMRKFRPREASDLPMSEK